MKASWRVKAMMNPTKLGNLPTSNGSRIQELLSGVARDVGESVGFIMAVCRRATEKNFVGTYMHTECK